MMFDDFTDSTLEVDRCDATVLQKDIRFSIRNRCRRPRGHVGDHAVPMDACEPLAQLVWSEASE